MKQTHLFLLTAHLGLAVACAPIHTTRIPSAPYPDPVGHSTISHERRPGIVRGKIVAESPTQVIAVALSGDECRDVNVEPALSSVKSERRIEGSAQSWLLVGGAALVGAGVVGALSKCPPVTGAASDGNVYSNECLPSDKTRQAFYQAAGVASIGLGVVAGGLFLANALRARDSEEVIRAPAIETPVAAWSYCSDQPVPNRHALLRISTGQELKATTDDDGRVLFAIGAVDPPGTAPSDLRAEVVLEEDGVSMPVDLIKTGIKDRWVAARDKSEKERDIRLKDQELSASLDRCRTATSVEKDTASLDAATALAEADAACGKLLRTIADAPESVSRRRDEVKAVLRASLPRIVDMAMSAIRTCHTPEDCETIGAMLRKLIGVLANAGVISDQRAQIARVDRAVADGKRVAAVEARRRDAEAKSRSARAVKIGRQTILGNLRAPSTARFVSDDVLHVCQDGDIVFSEHTVDAQNGFGAMLRDNYCAATSMSSGLSTVLLNDCSVIHVALAARRMGIPNPIEEGTMTGQCKIYDKLLNKLIK